MTFTPIFIPNFIPTLKRLCAFGVIVAATSASLHAQAQAPSLVMSSTTSTEQSGLFAHLLPEFKRVSGIDIKVVALGTGQALDVARRGDADVVLVHDEAQEIKFVAEGYATKRFAVMVNDFVLVGPKDDPAKVAGKDIAKALQAVGRAPADKANFVSRGDRSGTHAAEQRYFAAAGVNAEKLPGFKSCGCGMGPALNIAAATGAYVLADRGTWLNFKNRADLAVLVEGDKQMFNPYSVMVVNPQKHPHVKADLAQKFVDWIVSDAGQKHIADYKIGGQQLFFPSAVK
jgi:tungstate transport system substrate-binding protein